MSSKTRCNGSSFEESIQVTLLIAKGYFTRRLAPPVIKFKEVWAVPHLMEPNEEVLEPAESFGDQMRSEDSGSNGHKLWDHSSGFPACTHEDTFECYLNECMDGHLGRCS